MKKLIYYLLVIVMFCSYPMVNAEVDADEPITITLLFPPNNALRPSMDVSEIWNYITEKTGITFDLQILESPEQLSLIIAGGDYPDMMANVGLTSNQLRQLVDAGALVDINKYMDEFIPSLKPIIEKYPLMYNQCLVDGGMYTMPWLNCRPGEMDIRCQWLYNDQWVKELGLSTPTTATELYEVLRAVKAAAGTGTIPVNVEPLLIQWDGYIAGQYPIYCAFGVLVSDQQTGDYLTVSLDGEVIGQAINPDIKEPLKYLAKLYAEGLIMPEAFTRDWNDYLLKTSSETPVQFLHFSVANRSSTYSKPMAPIDNELNRPVYVRVRADSGNPPYASIVFDKGDEEKIQRIMKFYEWALNIDNAFTITYGMEGVVWDKTDDGKYMLNFGESNVELYKKHSTSVGLMNSWFGILTRETFSEHYFSPLFDQEGTVEYAVRNIYQDYLIDPRQQLIFGELGEDDTIRTNELASDLTAIRQEYMINWVMGNNDIDSQWDEYVQTMKQAGYDEWLALKQKAYDALMNK